MALRDLRGQATRRSAEDLLRHLQTFELEMKFSVGIWYFAPFAGRFHAPYGPTRSVEERLELVSRLGEDGVVAVEAHYPNEISEANLDLWKAFSRDTGIRILTVVPNLFWDAQFEFGSLSSPIPQVRRAAIDRTEAALRLNAELGTDFAVVWPGIDGYEHSFGQDFVAARDRFARGLAEAMDAVPGVRVAFEPKPYEPRGRILYGTTAEGILLGQKVEARLQHAANRDYLAEGHALVGMNPEAAHMLMGYEDMAYSLSLIMEYGRLAHTHWNSQPLGNYDQDLNVGAVSPEQTEAALYVMKMYGYREHFGIDINPERMPVVDGVRASIEALRSANDRINAMDHERIVWAMEYPQQARGWLERYLIRMRALHPDRLPPLAWPGAP
ncbi:MAG: TIM barrel protein [Firmicutes bacterium]|nr:TIM barrel protein [Bacillota bacterium]